MPDAILVHVGYHRTGSSWLQKFLFAGDGTGLRWVGKAADDHPVRKLILARWSEWDPRASRAEFDALFAPILADGLVPVVSFERLSGHAVSGGYDSGAIADRLRQVFPEGQVLIVIREQRSAIVSNYSRYVKAGGPESLREFLDPPFTTNLRVPWFDFRHFEYHHLIRRYSELFGPEALLVRTYEQFVREPREFVTAIADFAGRPLGQTVLDSLPYDTHVQGTLSPTSRLVLRHLNRFVRSEVNPAPLVDLDKHRTLKRLSRHRFFEVAIPETVAARNEKSLHRVAAEIVGDRYVESNRVTAELTGIDLGGYGWQV